MLELYAGVTTMIETSFQLILLLFMLEIICSYIINVSKLLNNDIQEKSYIFQILKLKILKPFSHFFGLDR